jgi:hypothetical protein
MATCFDFEIAIVETCSLIITQSIYVVLDCSFQYIIILINTTEWNLQKHIKKLLIMMFSPLPCYLVPLRPSPIIIYSTLYIGSQRIIVQYPT